MADMRKMLMCFAALVLVVLSISAEASVAPLFFASGAVSPSHPQDSIRMDSEEVTIRLKKNSYTVVAVFHFFNASESTTERIGFPKSAWGQQPDSREPPDFIRFRVWVDDTSVVFAQDTSLPQGADGFPRNISLGDEMEFEWMVGRVRFLGHAKTTVRVEYEAPYAVGTAYYIYGTGSFWKDNIGRAAFIIDATDVGGIRNTRIFCGTNDRPRMLTDNMVRYEIREFKPRPKAQIQVIVQE